MAKGASAEKAVREIRRRVPERLLQKFLEHADPESTRCCAPLADSALVQVLRPHEGGQRQIRWPGNDRGARGRFPRPDAMSGYRTPKPPLYDRY